MNRREFLLLTGAPLERLSAAEPHQSTPAAGHPTQLKMMSFNVRYINSDDTGWKTWANRRDWVVEIIAREDPDILGVQEAQRPIIDDLRKKLPGLDERGVGREDGKALGEFSAIFFRKDRVEARETGTFWLSDTPYVPNSRTWGNKVTRICTWVQFVTIDGRRPFAVFNTHLDHESQPAREKGIDLILDRIAQRSAAGPVFLMGDLNAPEDNPVIKRIAAAPTGFVDTWRKLHRDVPAAESGTFHAFSGARDRAKIDYIFAPAVQRIVSAEILRDTRDGKYPSDHFPVTAKIEL